MKRVLETVCSFLNTAGGTLVVGIEDQTRAVLGLDDVEKHVCSSGEHQSTYGAAVKYATYAMEDRHAAVLAAIDELERPNTADIQLQTGVSTRSLGRDLRRLREEGVIEFVGAPQTGFYRRT